MSAAAARQQPLRSPSDQRRSSLIAKIHVAKSQLRMTDDDYRSILVDEASVMSSTKASTEGLVAVLERMKRLGFKALPPKPRRKSGHVASRVADHPTARKARAMWLSLHQLGVVHNPSEEALEAFACKQLKIAKLQWADQATGYRLIEALKAMAERAQALRPRARRASRLPRPWPSALLRSWQPHHNARSKPNRPARHCGRCHRDYKRSSGWPQPRLETSQVRTRRGCLPPS